MNMNNYENHKTSWRFCDVGGGNAKQRRFAKAVKALSYRHVIPAQWLYDIREVTGFCSGTDLHDLFLEVCGEPAPSGNRKISCEALFLSHLGRQALREILSPNSPESPSLEGVTWISKKGQQVIIFKDQSHEGYAIPVNGLVINGDRFIIRDKAMKPRWTPAARVFFKAGGETS